MQMYSGYGGGIKSCPRWRARERRKLLNCQIFRPRRGVDPGFLRQRFAAQRLQGLAQHLAALAEGGSGDFLQAESRAGASGSARGSSRTMAEVTDGGGTKALRLTSNRILAVQRHCASTDSRP